MMLPFVCNHIIKIFISSASVQLLDSFFDFIEVEKLSIHDKYKGGHFFRKGLRVEVIFSLYSHFLTRNSELPKIKVISKQCVIQEDLFSLKIYLSYAPNPLRTSERNKVIVT